MRYVIAVISAFLLAAASSTLIHSVPLYPTRPGVVAALTLRPVSDSLPVPGVVRTSDMGGRLQ